MTVYAYLFYLSKGVFLILFIIWASSGLIDLKYRCNDMLNFTAVRLNPSEALFLVTREHSVVCSNLVCTVQSPSDCFSYRINQWMPWTTLYHQSAPTFSPSSLCSRTTNFMETARWVAGLLEDSSSKLKSTILFSLRRKKRIVID